MKRFNLKKTNQQGLVSIVVTLIIMLVLSLIVTGFAQLARREQREALDRELATQAQYAAESGINVVRRAIKDKIIGDDFEQKSVCDTDLGGLIDAPAGLDTSGNTQITCLLVKQKMEFLEEPNAQPEKSTIYPINFGGTVNPSNSIDVSWQNKEGGQNIPPFSSTLPSSWGSDDVSIMRIDVVDASTYSANHFFNNTMTFFAYPTANEGGSISFSSVKSDQGGIVKANCDQAATGSTKQCQMTITGLAAHQYYIRFKPLFKLSEVNTCANACDGTTTLDKAQTEVDATGRANDVLKRVKVRFRSYGSGAKNEFKPEYSMENGEGICKKYAVWPGDSRDPGTCGL